jgi:AbrB family looped-hinge helix DNA binding protein
MLQTVRITSKRQITIPVKIFNQLDLNKGDRLIVEVDSNRIIFQKAQQLLDELAGSLGIPQRYKNKSLDFIIREAKKEYFIAKK